MSARKKVWASVWRIGVGALLLVWIVHSIFVNEAREQAGRGRLVDRGVPVTWNKTEQPPRLEQWRLGWKHGPPALWTTLRSVEPLPFVISVLLVGLAVGVGIVRWRTLLLSGGFKLTFKRAAEISFVAHFFNSLMLGTVGGDVMKAYYAARETHQRKNEAVVTVLVDRVIGLWAMLTFATLMILPNLYLFRRSGLRAAAVPLLKDPMAAIHGLFTTIMGEPLLTATAVLVIMTIAASVFVFLAFRGGVSKKWSSARAWLRRLPKGDGIERLLDACRAYGQAPGALASAFLLSMVVNLLCVSQFWVLARGLKLDVPFLALCLIAPTIVCISALPIAPSGIGVRENLFVHLLAIPAIAAPATASLSLSLLAFAGSLFWSLVGGVVYMLFKQKHHLTEKELAENEG